MKKWTKAMAFFLVLALLLGCGMSALAEEAETTEPSETAEPVGTTEPAETEGDGTSVSPYAATYGESGTTSTYEGNEISPAYSKYIKDNGDGTYDLTLDVTGATGTEEDPALVDILFVVDTSGSMDKNMSGNNTNTESDKRLYKVKTAITNLLTALENNNEIDAKYDLLSFASTANTPTGWGDADTVTTALDNLGAEGGTNYQDALVNAGSEIQNARSNAIKIVFFLTDGLPQHCLATTSTSSDYDFSLSTTSGGGPGGGQTTTYTYYKLSNSGEDVSFVGYYGTDAQEYGSWHGSIMGASAVTCDYFYAVGFGDEMEKAPTQTGEHETQVVTILDDKSPLELLQAVADGTNAGTKEANVTGDLSAYFENITSTITNITVSDVTITDTLSDYAQATANSKLVITATGTDESGEEQTLTANGTISDGASLTIGSYTITASYDKDSKKVTLDFPDDYTLAEKWTYSVTLTIEPTDAAYTYYAQHGTYPHTGDDGTDAPNNYTSAGKEGFYCNSNATLEYKIITGDTPDNGHTQTYAHPVIQVKTTTVTITKQVTGNMGDTSKAFSFTVTCSSAMKEATNSEYTLSDNGTVATFSLSSGNSVTLNGVKKGSTLTISEVSGSYEMTVTVGDETLKANGDGSYSYEVPTNGSDLQITVTNNKEVTIDTGVLLDAIPYVLILAVVAAGVVFLVLRRRRSSEE